MGNAYRMLVGIPEDRDVYGRIFDVEIIVMEWESVFVLMWLAIGTSGGLLRTRL
jgi:hypothetical protein